jgi:hypothetical protein
MIHLIFIGDYGNTNAGSNALTIQLAILYSCPQSALVINSVGYVQMQYGLVMVQMRELKQILKPLKMH